MASVAMSDPSASATSTAPDRQVPVSFKKAVLRHAKQRKQAQHASPEGGTATQPSTPGEPATLAAPLPAVAPPPPAGERFPGGAPAVFDIATLFRPGLAPGPGTASVPAPAPAPAPAPVTAPAAAELPSEQAVALAHAMAALAKRHEAAQARIRTLEQALAEAHTGPPSAPGPGPSPVEEQLRAEAADAMRRLDEERARRIRLEEELAGRQDDLRDLRRARQEAEAALAEALAAGPGPGAGPDPAEADRLAGRLAAAEAAAAAAQQEAADLRAALDSERQAHERTRAETQHLLEDSRGLVDERAELHQRFHQLTDDKLAAVQAQQAAEARVRQLEREATSLREAAAHGGTLAAAHAALEEQLAQYRRALAEAEARAGGLDARAVAAERALQAAGQQAAQQQADAGGLAGALTAERQHAALLARERDQVLAERDAGLRHAAELAERLEAATRERDTFRELLLQSTVAAGGGASTGPAGALGGTSPSDASPLAGDGGDADEPDAQDPGAPSPVAIPAAGTPLLLHSLQEERDALRARIVQLERKLASFAPGGGGGSSSGSSGSSSSSPGPGRAPQEADPMAEATDRANSVEVLLEQAERQRDALQARLDALQSSSAAALESEFTRGQALAEALAQGAAERDRLEADLRHAQHQIQELVKDTEKIPEFIRLYHRQRDALKARSVANAQHIEELASLCGKQRDEIDRLNGDLARMRQELATTRAGRHGNPNGTETGAAAPSEDPDRQAPDHEHGHEHGHEHEPSPAVTAEPGAPELASQAADLLQRVRHSQDAYQAARETLAEQSITSSRIVFTPCPGCHGPAIDV
ncbi:hypothetical protein H696_05977 [Fonticula alba]|uniref:Uncharacterized protein n=1 Tax=Fonticula alba TaxID=691883 RepID=A0A058Z017_FONAL|nr:hypothetical protein H696_05977 [Fonticula alba]KCV67580.1 hypothetical protein H696_05977 [Fonticula alba]|eukprot:XP_009498021.1 hypothetical protein H696_05977 [Fonticula alba]